MTPAAGARPWPAWLTARGAAAQRIAAVDWSAHPLGPAADWPPDLRLALLALLASPEAMYLVWGEARTFFFNDVYAPVLGPRLDQAMGARFEMLWPDAWPAVRATFAKALAGRSSRFVDMPIAMARNGDPEATWWTSSYTPAFCADGTVAGVLCLLYETTAQVGRQAQMDASEERNRQILDSAIDYAIIATDLDGRIVRWNEGAHRVLGWSEAEMMGRTVERFFTPEDRAAGAVAAEMRRALATGEGQDERWHVRRSGERFWAKGEMTVLRNASGAAAGFVKVLRDRTAEYRATEALAESEASLRRAQEAGQVGVFSVGSDNLVHGTREFCRIFGIDACDGVPAETIEALIVPEDRKFASDARRRADGVSVLNVEYRIHRADTGEERWIARRGEFETDADGSPVRLVGVVHDITERHTAHRALTASEAKFRAFTEAVPNQVWTARPDGMLDWANRRVYDYSGGERRYGEDGGGDLPGDAWLRRIHADDQARVGTAWARALTAGEPYEVEFRLLRHDGAYRWHLARALPLTDATGVVRWLGTNTDIDDQRAARETLADLNAALERRVREEVRERDRLWSTTNDLMGTGGLDGHLKKINPAWHRLLGHDEATLLARPFADFIDPADHPTTRSVITRLAQGEAVGGFLNHVIAADGTVHAIMWNGVPEGDVFYVVGRDVTEQHAIEERLRQSQKMEAVGQLTGGIAHDFNNMLTGVIGSMELLKRHLAAGRTDRVDRYIDAATTSAQRAAGLTQRLLAFSRRQSLDVRAVPVNELIVGLEELLGRTLGENIGLTVALGADIGSATTDANQLESAILNLTINARDAMPDGGRLTIETATVRLDEGATAAMEGVAPGDFVRVSVADTGSGMTPDVLANAFDPFFTTKPIGQGTGLGLSMIYGFARQSGGHVQIRSQPGRGTTVTLYLPRHAGTAERRAGPEADAPPAAAGECVLLVEDDPAVRMLVGDVLQDLGYAVTQAGDGREALSALERIGRLDLLITDVGLPGMNGRQLAEAVRAQRPGLKILFVTGYAEQARNRATFLDEGMDMITKPFAITGLSAKIRAMLG